MMNVYVINIIGADPPIASVVRESFASVRAASKKCCEISGASDLKWVEYIGMSKYGGLIVNSIENIDTFSGYIAFTKHFGYTYIITKVSVVLSHQEE